MTWDCDECYSQKQLCESCAVEKKKLPELNKSNVCVYCNGTGVVEE